MPFDLLRAASDLIGVDTVSDHGNLPLVPVVARLCEQVGLTVEVSEHDAAGARHANLLMALPGASERDSLLLVTHTDTVPPGPLERWTTSPWVARLDGDRLHGLGSADVKVDLCAKLLAAERWRGRTLRRGFFVLGTFGEEVGLLGAKAFVRSERLRPRYVVCGEPSELTLIHAHKGYLVARVKLGRPTAKVIPTATLRFEGRAAHSSTPERGENALEKALATPLDGAVAVRGGQGANSVPAHCEVDLGPRLGAGLPIAELRRAMESWHALIAAQSPLLDARFDPPGAVSNVGWLQASEGQAELLLDARLLPGHDPRAIAQAYAEAIAELSGTVAFERENPAVWTDPTGELCTAAQRASSALGLSTVPRTKATNTEAAAFAGGCEALVFGPGPSLGNAHCPNEHTSMAQVRIAIDWYERLIGELCS